MDGVMIEKNKIPAVHCEDHVFMFDHNLKEMSFYCGDDNCFVATFTDNNGESFRFTMSRQKVMEHVERHSAHPEKYLTNKGLIVAHFQNMAKAWYDLTH